MKILVIAGDAEKRQEIAKAVLEATQSTGVVRTTSHTEGREICLRQRPDLVIICDYDEVSPMSCGIGFQTYCSISEIMPEEGIIRMGDKPFKYDNHCRNVLSLQALVYMRYRELGGVPMASARR